MPTPRETAALDQLRSAARDAGRAVRLTSDLLGTTYTPGVPDWLTPHINALDQTIRARTDTGCPHRWRTAQILHAAVWAPGQITCAWCWPTLLPPPGEDHTCDRCRQHADRLINGTVQLGPILLAFGICTPCHTGQPADITRKETQR